MTSAPPPGRFDVDVSEDQVEEFREAGFLAIQRLTTDEEVAWLSRVYDELYAMRSGLPDGVFDLVAPYGSQDEPQVGQLLFPEMRTPTFTTTLLWRNARKVASRLLDLPEGELRSWGHLIAKPAFSPAATPWHQDEAYWDVHFDYRAVGSWAPMDDATVENGCLWFLPGSHRGGVAEHRHLGDDPAVHLLEAVDPVDTTTAVPVPVAAGGASFHHPRLMHYAGPNTTARARRAWANEFQSKPQRRDEPADRPWVLAGEQALAAAEQRRISSRQGGPR